jgi:LysM repeat protein
MQGMKRFFWSAFLVFGLGGPASSWALPVDSIGTVIRDGKKYIRHEVEAGETWYAISRKYGVSFTELKLANRGSSDLLKTGQVLLVPLVDGKRGANRKHDTEPVTNTPDKTAVTATRFHTVGAGETLFGIARKYSVSVEDLRNWNDLQGNTLRKGQKLKIRLPEAAEPNPVKVHETIVPEQPPVEREPVRKPEPAAPATPESKPEPDVPVKVQPEKRSSEPEYVFTNGRKKVTEQGMAGWVGDEDINPNRYYALHHSAPNGTIIRVTNRMTNAAVFVKVVGRLPEAGENEGMIIKISKAAADKLGVIDQRFQVDLLYGVPEK